MCVSCHRKFDMSDYQRERMKSLMKDVPAPNRVKVAQYEDDNLVAVYDSLTEASIATGVLVSSIAQGISGKTKKPGGFIWRRIR